jgi:putative transposase
MAETRESLTHTRWDCKYHIVLIPKCRRAVLYRELRKYLGGDV